MLHYQYCFCLKKFNFFQICKSSEYPHCEERWQSLTDLDLVEIVDGMVCHVGVSFKFEENWNDSVHGFAA